MHCSTASLASGDLDTKAGPNISSLGSTTSLDWNGVVMKKEKLSMGLVAQMKESSGGRLIAETELEEMKMKKSSGGCLMEEMRVEMQILRDQFENFSVQLEARHMEAEARYIEMKKEYVNMELILEK